MNVFYHHEHSHSHEHSHEEDPMQEAIALLDYMIKHNFAHADELEHLARKFADLGKVEVAEQIQRAFCDFYHANESLVAVIELLK